MYVIANGGMTTHNIRNTLDAVFLTKNASYTDGVLIDIRLSKDNQLVLMKDDNLEVDTLGKGYVSKTNYNDLKKVKFPSKIFKYYIPTLEEILKGYNSEKLIVLNLHDAISKNEFMVREVLRIIKKYPMYNFYLETSSKYLLGYLITLASNYKIGFKISFPPKPCNGKTSFCDVYYTKCNLNINSYQGIMTHVINNLHELNYFLNFINEDKLNDLLIITDYPKRIKNYLSKLLM